MNKKLRDIFIPFHYVSNSTYLAILGVWLGAFTVLWLFAPVLIPSPLEMFSKLSEYLTDSDFYGDVFASMAITFSGMIASIFVSCLLAYLSVISLFKPLAYFIVKLRYMSMAGFGFMFTILFHGDASDVKLFLLMLGVVPFFTLSLLNVIEKIPQEEFDLWTTLRYNKWEQLWHIMIKGRADVTIEVIRSNFAIAWAMIIMVESYSMSMGGVGVLLFKAAGKTQIDRVFALQFFVICLAILIDYLLKKSRTEAFPHIKLAERS